MFYIHSQGQIRAQCLCYLIDNKLYKVKKDKTQGDLFGSYKDGKIIEGVEETTNIITVKDKKSKSKNNEVNNNEVNNNEVNNNEVNINEVNIIEKNE